MDAALALIAYLFPKLKMPQVLGLALALLLYRSRNLNSFAFRNDVREDGVSAILTALVLLALVYLGKLPGYAVLPAIFVSSFRMRLHYFPSMGVYFVMAFLYLNYFSNPWDETMRALISLTLALGSTLIMHANRESSPSLLLMLTSLSILLAFDIYRIDVSDYELILGFVSAFILSLIAYRSGVADETGLMAATITGMLIIVSADFRFFIALLLFYAVGSAVTKYKYRQKEMLGIGEPAGGARGYVNVFANSLPALFFAMNYGYFREEIYAMAFIASLSTALGDTMASEIGKTAERVYLITTLERVRPGVSGGVSAIGELSAFLGSAIIPIYATVSGILQPEYAVIAMVAGFAGVHVDSLLGATLENKGWLNNAGVNFFATLSSGALCLLIALGL
ncbi:TIGR00297 family protein [Geoglobus ahangari]|uniref:TIGR00297 family protein n=1 Tax=Geoglobus ahangari TaxID=113653 RepID=A0A0F7ICL2_9EURY|nr:TIGR00297 family protein [Geoglobus ahangari]AKG91020.1 TIGR00297 family protein [Geoglobus ahangari]